VAFWGHDRRVTLHAGQRAGGIRVTYRAGGGAVVDTTLDRLCADEVIAGLPVREFRWYEGRRHHSGWYWCATGQRLIVCESRLELARIMLADFDPAVARSPRSRSGSWAGMARVCAGVCLMSCWPVLMAV
jgi:hypothetical protein